jgi:hypothetical protein
MLVIVGIVGTMLALNTPIGSGEAKPSECGRPPRVFHAGVLPEIDKQIRRKGLQIMDHWPSDMVTVPRTGGASLEDSLATALLDSLGPQTSSFLLGVAYGDGPASLRFDAGLAYGSLRLPAQPLEEVLWAADLEHRLTLSQIAFVALSRIDRHSNRVNNARRYYVCALASAVSGDSGRGGTAGAFSEVVYELRLERGAGNSQASDLLLSASVKHAIELLVSLGLFPELNGN